MNGQPIVNIDAAQVDQAANQGVNARINKVRFADAGAVALSPIPESWTMKREGTAATFTNCYYQREMCVKECANVTDGKLTGTVATTGTVWVGVEIADVSGNGTIITGSTLASVSHAAPPEDQSVNKLPLYKVVNGKTVWRAGGIPRVGVYQ